MKEKNIYGERLKDCLDELDIKQNELAQRTGITEATISNYISGKQLPKLGVVEKIATVLNVSVDYLLGLSDIKTYNYNEDYLDEEKSLMNGDILFTDFLFRNNKKLDKKQKINILEDLILNMQIYLRDLYRQKEELSSTEYKEKTFDSSLIFIQNEILSNTNKLKGLNEIKRKLNEKL